MQWVGVGKARKDRTQVRFGQVGWHGRDGIEGRGLVVWGDAGRCATDEVCRPVRTNTSHKTRRVSTLTRLLVLLQTTTCS